MWCLIVSIPDLCHFLTFLKGKSCVTQLLEYLEDITEAMDNGNDMDVIYLDFCEAFDKIPHQRLLKKLEKYGIKGNC